jgi:hypothetical protein
MESLLTRGGYAALVLFGFPGSCCDPMSSDATSGFAGMLAYQGHLSLALVIVLGTPASGSAPAAPTAPDGHDQTQDVRGLPCGDLPGHAAGHQLTQHGAQPAGPARNGLGWAGHWRIALHDALADGA